MSEYDDWKQENDRWEAYLYPNGVLRNKLGITKAAKWHKMERGFVTARNADFQPRTGLTTGNVGEELFAVHQYLFQDCYDWAGQPRNVWMFKGHTTFAGPDDIIPMLEEVNADIAELDWDNNDIDADDLKHYINAAQLGEIHARLNLIHPFREASVSGVFRVEPQLKYLAYSSIGNTKKVRNISIVVSTGCEVMCNLGDFVQLCVFFAAELF